MRLKDFVTKSPLMVQKKGDALLSSTQYKWATLDCLCIFPIVMSILIIPLAYKKSAWSFLVKYGYNFLPKGFEWGNYISIVIGVYYSCILVHIMITTFFIENIRINVDLLKKIATLLLPMYLVIWWGNPINLEIKSKSKYFLLIALILIINYIFSEFFEYINARAQGRWYVTKPISYGLDFFNKKYYLAYGLLTVIALISIYFYNQTSNQMLYHVIAIIIILCAFSLILITVLLGWERKGVNNMIACEIAISTAMMSNIALINIEMFCCVLLASYFTEQIQIWIERFIQKTTVQEQKKYMSDISTKILSGYGIIGIITIAIINFLEHGL